MVPGPKSREMFVNNDDDMMLGTGGNAMGKTKQPCNGFIKALLRVWSPSFMNVFSGEKTLYEL